MPELPEVDTVRRTLEPLLTGHVIERVHLGDYRRCIATPEPDAFVETLSGRTITGMGRRGKFILINLDDARVLTVHLRMTGELRIDDPAAPDSPHLHIQFDLEDGRQLRYYDVRKFGRWSLLSPEQYVQFDASLGVEPFDPMLDDERFASMLASRKRILKPLLLDQTFIAGIGNIYADEALFRARIHPLRRSNDIEPQEAVRLLEEIRNVLSEALENRGTTLQNYRDGSGKPGEYQTSLRMYSRAAGDPCPVCGSPVERAVIGQRGTRYCPTCQPVMREQANFSVRR